MGRSFSVSSESVLLGKLFCSQAYQHLQLPSLVLVSVLLPS